MGPEGMRFKGQMSRKGTVGVVTRRAPEPCAIHFCFNPAGGDPRVAGGSGAGTPVSAVRGGCVSGRTVYAIECAGSREVC